MIKRKMLFSALAFAIAIPTVVQTAAPSIKVEAASKATFKDIPTTHPAYSKIETLVDKKIISGLPDGSFGSTMKVTRGQFATFIGRVLDLPMPSTVKVFKDVPKSNYTYEGVAKANAAGIITGYPGGEFKPNNPVSRIEMAIMLDRALQKAGSYKQTSPLKFADNDKILKSAVGNVERITHYGIMKAHKSNKFEPYVEGDRLLTVLSLYELMKTTGMLEEPSDDDSDGSLTDIEAIKKKHPRDLTLPEIELAYGEMKIVQRWDLFGQNKGFEERNLWKEYIYDMDNASKFPRPDEWLAAAKKEWLNELFYETSTSYPDYEVISVNGKPYLSSDILDPLVYDKFVQVRGDLLPTPPTSNGEFVIDVLYKKHDFARYGKDSVSYGEQNVLPYLKNGDVYMEAAVIFNNTPIKVTNDDVSYNGKTVVFSSLSKPVENNNGKLMLPVREVAHKLGLHTRVINTNVYSNPAFQKIQIRNYVPTPSFAFDDFVQ